MNNDLDTPKKFINHLSLCTGYEGIGEGLRNIFPNLREVAYVEREAYAIANLVAKMEEGKLVAAPIHTDVKTFPYRRFLNKIFILSGGFPCQPFSQAANDKKSTEDERHLFPYILEGIKQCRPQLVFLENVHGIISTKTTDGESVLKYVLRSLEQVGYETTSGVFSAQEVGYPHERKRVFILGNSKNRGSRREIQNCESERLDIKSSCADRQGNQLSNTESIGCRGGNSSSKNKREWTVLPREQEGREVVSQTERCSRNHSPWVARPNEPQHEWEEPRAKPKLGRTTNGFDSRLDRLRLLGNGVVPATAERAFRVLSSRLI